MDRRTCFAEELQGLRADVVVPWLPAVFLSQSDGIGEENEVSLAASQYSVAQGEKNLSHPG